MNLSNRKLKDALILAGQQAASRKFKESWLIKVGNATLKYEVRKKHGEILYTFKLNKSNNIDVYDSKGAKVNEIAGKKVKSKVEVSQNVSDAPVEKTNKSTKQQK